VWCGDGDEVDWRHLLKEASNIQLACSIPETAAVAATATATAAEHPGVVGMLRLL
jgi:hypothetical protein